MEYKIIKTQGTNESIGAFMVWNKQGNYLFDKKGNNAWDTLQEAKKVLRERKEKKDERNHLL